MAEVEETVHTGQLSELACLLERDDELARLLDALRAGQSGTLDGVWGSACALVAAALSRAKARGGLLYICADGQSIDNIADDFRLFSPGEICTLPPLDTTVREKVLMDDAYGQRLRTLKQLLSPASGERLIVTSIQALLQPVPARATLSDQSRIFRVGQAIDLEELARWLTQNRYHPTTAVELPGEFSLRGGLLDIFATDWLDPVRIETFGDDVESIRRFSVESQRSLQNLLEVEVTVLGKTTRADAHFVEYLPANSWALWEEFSQICREGQQFLERVERPQELHSLSSVTEGLAGLPSLFAASLAESPMPVSERLRVESVERFGGDVAAVREQIAAIGTTYNVHVVSQTEGEIRRLREILAQTPVAQSGRLTFPLGRLRTGFELPQHATIVLSGAQLFGRADVRRASRRHAGKAIDSFLELREGDLVVHLAHGIGRYRGLEVLGKEGHVEEHLKIEFHGGTKLFVPASRIELVQKYVGARQARPRLATIGGQQWLKQKDAAAQAVTDLAIEMLELHAERESQTGVSLGADTDWQYEFDAAFPYHETPDQLIAIDDVKRDLMSHRPMDRLLCGDVGFGKTEVAMRAAFKAVDNGFQVAVLVPTTILAEQHYKSFRQRMAEFPFEIGKLSRFASAVEQRRTVKRLAEGSIDIVVGTHRLASKDVCFNNLGLLVIDEEQRFGVSIKDRLKALRSSVNVLTLSATPIPRTLHMALTGLRGISNLETPPEDRIAVETRVTRWSNETIHHAIMRELSRGGQIYFVHNRVHDIHRIAERLKAIVPEARIGIGHGQMLEDQLEQVMIDFIDHKYDLLLATTIIESGLDIPNANTIFIDDADQYGLADLHQLRGRVGRYKNRAYCYLLVEPSRSLSPAAARRLHAIEEFSEMGAGFAIAMRDLEIRGAGNILGTQQSGHIASIGYELYCQLLEAAVRRLRKLPAKLQVDVTLELPGEAYLPREYVPDLRAKIDLYRRLARTMDEPSLTALREELRDRFGPLPEPTERLLELARLRNDATIWQIRRIHLEKPYLVFVYGDRQRAEQLARGNQGRLRLVDEECLYHPLPANDLTADQTIALARQLLQP